MMISRIAAGALCAATLFGAAGAADAATYTFVLTQDTGTRIPDNTTFSFSTPFPGNVGCCGFAQVYPTTGPVLGTPWVDFYPSGDQLIIGEGQADGAYVVSGSTFYALTLTPSSFSLSFPQFPNNVGVQTYSVEDWTGGTDNGSYTLTLTAVPEASTWAMLLVGFAGLGFAGYRRAKPVAAL